MISFFDGHWLATLIFERLLFCLTAGTALIVILWVVLRLLPVRNSHTRFAVWFSAMLAIVVLPLAFTSSLRWFISSASGGSAHPLVTVPTFWAEWIVLGWVLLVLLGFARIAFGLWQLRRLRRSCSELDIQALGPQAKEILATVEPGRRVLLLVSEQLEIPTAIGFVRPAIILPAWMLEDRADGNPHFPAEEDLKYILLHEMAHLRRRDDWTNLVQRMIKSVLFFHPGMWWIERKLGLDREMACDDLVVAQTSSPRAYAQCLTSVAEKSFLRRQIALAQAAVSRVKQLSHRVAGIMDESHPRRTNIWKPAIPMVAAVAVLCAVSASDTTQLVGFNDGNSQRATVAANAGVSKTVISHGVDRVMGTNPLQSSMKVKQAGTNSGTSVRALPATLKIPRRAQALLNRKQASKIVSSRAEARPVQDAQPDPFISLASLVNSAPLQKQTADQARPAQVVLVLVTRQLINEGGTSVSSWELFFYVPGRKQIPSKT